jgi:transposase
VLPGIERQLLKKLEPSPERLLAVLHRWRDEAAKAGKEVTRIALAFEAGRDGVWLKLIAPQRQEPSRRIGI